MGQVSSCSGAISVPWRALLRLWTDMRDGVLDVKPSSAVYWSCNFFEHGNQRGFSSSKVRGLL